MLYFLYTCVRRVFKNTSNGVNDILVFFWMPPTSYSTQVGSVHSSPSKSTLKRNSHSKEVCMVDVENSYVCTITWETID